MAPGVIAKVEQRAHSQPNYGMSILCILKKQNKTIQPYYNGKILYKLMTYVWSITYHNMPNDRLIIAIFSITNHGNSEKQVQVQMANMLISSINNLPLYIYMPWFNVPMTWLHF